MDKTLEWHNCFFLVAKPTGKVRLFLDPAILNQALTRPVHRGPTLKNTFPKLNNVKYLSPIEASSAYHNLKVDERPSYLTSACQFGRHGCYQEKKYWHFIIYYIMHGTIMVLN